MAYTYKAEGRWDSDEIWLMLKDEFYQLQEEYEETRNSLTLQLNRLRVKVLNRSYCSLYYWPYSRYSSTFCSPYTSEFSLTDQGIEEEKLRAHQQINSFNYNHMLFVNSLNITFYYCSNNKL